MHRALVDCGIAMLTAALIAASSAPSLAKVTVPPAERCNRLSRQVDEAIKAKAADKQVAAASALEKRETAHVPKTSGLRESGPLRKL